MKASVSHDTAFQHQTALESDSDKLVSSTLDSAAHVFFDFPVPIAHSPDNGKVLALLQNIQLCRGRMKRIPCPLLKV